MPEVLYVVSLQTFTVKEPVWLKYLQFHFISHHGSEPICALNDVLVFGKSAAEDLEDQLSDEALLTRDDRPQQPGTALDASAAADRQHPHLQTLGKLDKSAAESDTLPQEAVKHSSAAVEADVEDTRNKSSAADVLLSGKAASDATREQSASEQASAGHHTGQQCCHLQSPCTRKPCIAAFSNNTDRWNLLLVREASITPSLCCVHSELQCRLTFVKLPVCTASAMPSSTQVCILDQCSHDVHICRNTVPCHRC